MPGTQRKVIGFVPMTFFRLWVLRCEGYFWSFLRPTLTRPNRPAPSRSSQGKTADRGLFFQKSGHEIVLQRIGADDDHRLAKISPSIVVAVGHCSIETLLSVCLRESSTIAQRHLPCICGKLDNHPT